jgi:hypothetical protein
MGNPQNKWRFIAGKFIYFHGPFSMAMLNNKRVDPNVQGVNPHFSKIT